METTALRFEATRNAPGNTWTVQRTYKVFVGERRIGKVVKSGNYSSTPQWHAEFPGQISCGFDTRKEATAVLIRWAAKRDAE
jgi:hypothetical protein